MQVADNYSVGHESPVLEAHGICKLYTTPRGALEVLRGLDLVVERGTILAILGVSGAGKSTLLNLLGSLDRPDSGQVRVGGLDLYAMGDGERARFRAANVGFVFQFHHLLPEFNAVENVMMPLLVGGFDLPEARPRAQEMLRRVGLAERWEHRPSALSGGEQQRVAVARALVASPQLVLADEPSGNLDARSAEALHELVGTLCRERHQTFVVVTHNEKLAAIADRVLVLSGGCLRDAEPARS